jgi:hypothetical protein
MTALSIWRLSLYRQEIGCEYSLRKSELKVAQSDRAKAEKNYFFGASQTLDQGRQHTLFQRFP